MENLISKKCTPCRGGILPLTFEQAQNYMPQVPGWSLIDNATKIERTFKLKNFAEAMNLAQKVGELAEEEDHHPEITFGWGYCKVLFYTHKINGLHENDFIIAAKVNQLIQPPILI